MEKVKRSIQFKLGAAAVILALLAAGGLWYTRPLSWSRLAPSSAVTALSAQYTEHGVSGGEGTLSTWCLDTIPAEEDAAQSILTVLRQSRYRASLWNLFPRSTVGESQIEGTVLLTLDGQTPLSLTLSSHDTMTLSDQGRFLTYRADEELYDALSRLIQQYGVWEEAG